MACEDDACETQINVSVALFPPEPGDTHIEDAFHEDVVSWAKFLPSPISGEGSFNGH